MARRAFVLENLNEEPGWVSYRVVMWFPVPQALRPRFADPYFVSRVQSAADRPNATELAAIRSGAWREQETLISIKKHKEDGSLRTDAELRTEFETRMLETYQRLLDEQNGQERTITLYGTTFDDSTGWKFVINGNVV